MSKKQVYYGYELESGNGIFRSWTEEYDSDALFYTEESARTEAIDTAKRWSTLHNSTIGVSVVKIERSVVEKIHILRGV